MAMEIKTMDVDNSQEAEAIEFYLQFGWNLKSSQRVYNQDSHLERRGDSIYSVTNTTNYTKLVFERDKNGPHYEEIVALENEFYSCYRALEEAKKKEKPINGRWKSMEGAFDFRTPEEKAKRKKATQIALFFMIFGGALFTIGFILGQISSIPYAVFIICFLLGYASLGAGVPQLIVSLVKNGTSKRQALTMAKNDPDSANGQIYKAEYDRFWETNYVIIQKRRNLEEQMETIIKRLNAII